MAHLIKDKKKLLHRVRRIQGQIKAVEKLFEEDHQDCANTLHTLAACRGAINGLISILIQGHIHEHVLDHTGKATPAQIEAAQELIDLFNSYLR